jgi:tRNA pseudouridine13 synthase
VRPATIKAAPEDFVVDEIPAYEPVGDGPHLFVHFRKRNLTTDAAVRAIAEALGIGGREIGVAGLKDKVAVTTQWISVPYAPGIEDRIAALSVDGVEILGHRRHGNKLKTGHLRGNAFRIVLRGIEESALGAVRSGFDRIGREGVPNAFGTQRFGREGDNYERARAWLTGKARGPGDPRARRFQFSAFQSWIFNLVLEERMRDGSWNKPLLGDLLKKEETGGMFVCTDVQRDRERADQGEVWPTGPIVGDRMRQPEAEALALEQRIVAPCIEGIDLHRARSLGEGTRRPLGLHVTELSYGNTSPDDEAMTEVRGSSGALGRREQGAAIEVRFVLPRGAYATTVLSNVLPIIEVTETPPAQAKVSEEE